MRRIEFIAPVEAMRGNLSGAQNLAYAKNDNKAFDAPEGRQYARNYDPRYIGAKIAASGKKIFSVKTKTATKINSASLLRMALLGGTGALYAAMLNNATVRANAEAYYELKKNSSEVAGRSFRKFWFDELREILATKKARLSLSPLQEPTLHVTVDNPWVATSEPNCPVSNETLVKFWLQLATNPIVFDVDGIKGVAHNDDSWNVLADAAYNVLDVSIEDGHAMIGTEYLQTERGGSWDYVDPTALIGSVADGIVYHLTATIPE